MIMNKYEILDLDGTIVSSSIKYKVVGIRYRV